MNRVHTVDGTAAWDTNYIWPYFTKFTYCPRCGRKTEPRENYCPVCGRYLYEKNVYYTPSVDPNPAPYPLYPWMKPSDRLVVCE